ncbi:FtsX-like permease family protein, partial [Angustibacter aerolatus]
GAAPAPLTVRPGPVTVGVAVEQARSPSPLTATLTVAVGDAWREVPLGRLPSGAGRLRGTVPAGCAPGCRLIGVAVAHPGTDLEGATARLRLTDLTTPGATAAFDAPGAWRAGTPQQGGAAVTLRRGAAGLDVELSTPGGVPARVVHTDAPDPLPAVVGPRTAAGDGVVPVTGLDARPQRVAPTGTAAFVPGLGRTGAVVDLELALRGTETPAAQGLQVWLGRDDPAAEQRLRTALGRDGVRVTGRSSAAAASDVLSRDGAVLALLLFLVCALVAVLVAAGALLVTAFVGAGQRATDAGALRAVGVRDRTLRAALLVEHLGGVGVGLVVGAVAAAVASWALLPVLPLFDLPSEVLSVRDTPDPVSFAWTLAAVAAGLALLAAGVARVQGRGNRVERVREGGR